MIIDVDELHSDDYNRGVEDQGGFGGGDNDDKGNSPVVRASVTTPQHELLKTATTSRRASSGGSTLHSSPSNLALPSPPSCTTLSSCNSHHEVPSSPQNSSSSKPTTAAIDHGSQDNHDDVNPSTVSASLSLELMSSSSSSSPSSGNDNNNQKDAHDPFLTDTTGNESLSSSSMSSHCQTNATNNSREHAATTTQDDDHDCYNREPTNLTSAAMLEDASETAVAATATTTTTHHSHDRYHFWERQARRVARYPKTHFWISLGIVLVLSVMSFLYGNFDVSVDNIGWTTRGTLISDRHTQYLLVSRNAKDYLGSYNDTIREAAWHDLTTRTQLGWQVEDWDNLNSNKNDNDNDDDDDNNDNDTSITDDPLGFLQDDGRQETDVLYQRKNLTTLIEQCDINYYLNGDFLGRNALWPVWKVKGDASALDPEILEELCYAEEQTQRLLEAHGLCFGCYNNTGCLPPYSIVLYSRFIVPQGFGMDCTQLAQAWAPYQESQVQRWLECSIYLNETMDGTELPDDIGPCPSIFSPSLVDDKFIETGGRVQMTSSAFVMNDWQSKESYDIRDQFGRGGDTIEGVYDTYWSTFVFLYATASAGRDVKFAAGGAIATTFAMLVHTRSPLLTFVALLQIALGFPLTYGIYYFLGGLNFFPFLNLIGIFVIFALGADHVFVAVDKWKNARNENPHGSTDDVAAKALPSAGNAMILTTITTAVAFFGSALCPVAPISLFAIFCGLLIVVDYILDVVIMFPCLCIYDGYRFQQNCWVDFRFAWERYRHMKSQGPEEDNEDAAAIGNNSVINNNNNNLMEEENLEEGRERNILLDQEGITDDRGHDFLDNGNETKKQEDATQDIDLEKYNWIRQVLHRYYNLLHSWRWPLLVASLVALGLCSYYATKLRPTVSMLEIQFLRDDVEFEKNRRWRKELMLESFKNRAGATSSIMWGAHPADTGDHNDPNTWSKLVLDDSFDPSTAAAQRYLLDFCDTLYEQDFAAPTTTEYNCSINEFDEWLKSQAALLPEAQNTTYVEHCANATGLPMSQTGFHACLSNWALDEDYRTILSRNGTVKIIIIRFIGNISFSSSNGEIDKEWHKIEDWMQDQNRRAPTEISNFFFTSFEYLFWDSSKNILDAAMNSALIAIAVSAAVIFLSSRSLSMTFFSAISVAYVLTSVTSMMSAAGWTLGTLECICFTILIGLSGDFVVHLSHAYTELPGETDRSTRSLYSLLHLGPSILAAGFTTLVGSAMMLFTVINFFQLFARIVIFTIVQATIGSFIVFLVLTDCFGPSNPTYVADNIGRWLSACDHNKPKNEKTN